MEKMTRERLHAMREEGRRALKDRRSAMIEIVVGMGTSGIASGAKATLAAFRRELDEQAVRGVEVRQTGSMGLDHAEPTVEVMVPGMPPVIYGKVDAETAVRIVRKHVMGGSLLNDHIYDRPSADIQR